MDNYMLIRVFLIIFAVVVLVVMVQRYNHLQQYNDSERFYDNANGTIRSIPADMSTPAPIQHVHHDLPAMPPPEVATPAREQIAKDARAVAYFQHDNHDSDITKFYDDFESPTLQDANNRHVASCDNTSRLTSDDLLPRDAANSKWAQINPAVVGSIKDQNFLQAGYHVGLNTSQGAKRNGNLQFRSEPPNAKTVVSPWLNSDYEPDLLRRPLEVGEN
jgi:hypothetical protein